MTIFYQEDVYGTQLQINSEPWFLEIFYGNKVILYSLI